MKTYFRQIIYIETMKYCQLYESPILISQSSTFASSSTAHTDIVKLAYRSRKSFVDNTILQKLTLYSRAEDPISFTNMTYERPNIINPHDSHSWIVRV